MRSWPVVLTATLDGPVLRWANCIKVTRRDHDPPGHPAQFGFTDHQVDLTVGGLVYESATGLDASTLDSNTGTGVDTLEMVGVVRSERITGADIRAGVWDAAEVELFWVDWQNPDGGSAVLLTGSIGEISEAEGQFTAELRSLSQHYSQQIGKQCSPMCRVKEFLNTVDCFIGGNNYDNTQTPASHRYSGAIVTAISATNARIITFDGPTTPAGGDTKASGYYKWGRVLFETGNNRGFEMDVKQHTIVAGTAQIELHRPFPYTVVLGDTAMLEAGCDRTFSMCVGTYLNGGNFQGEPHLPGPEAMMKTGRKQEPADRFQGLRSRVVR